MQSEELIFGPPGCGKTYTLMEVLKKELENGTPPSSIGFVSFSRKAIAEAKDRAASVLKLSEKDLPYFRTLHSMGFHWLGLKKEEIIGHYDLKQIGAHMGMVFDTREPVNEDGVMQLLGKEGNKYLTLINRSAMRKVSLEQEYNDIGDYSIKWPMLEKLDRVYSKYKSETGKFDFTDMIKLMVEQGQGPSLDVLIVDEVQDLTPLQWDQVLLLRDNAKRIWYAGDDDQAIYRFTGVDVRQMLGLECNTRVLDQSYRVPRAVHKLAQTVASRILNRQPKLWNPTDREGSLNYHMRLEDIDMTKGSWTIMARTTARLRAMGEDLKTEGHLFLLNGYLSINEKKLKAMNHWNALLNGEYLNHSEAVELYDQLPKRGEDSRVKHGMNKALTEADPTRPYSFHVLTGEYGLLATKEMRAEDLLKLSVEEVQYLKAIQRRGEITFSPRIKLSTIHRMKGGEDDNVVVSQDMGYLPFKAMDENPDDEHRVFYTAITRAKENLHILDTRSKYRYPL